MDVYKFQASLIYRASSKTANPTGEPYLKKPKQKPKIKKKKNLEQLDQLRWAIIQIIVLGETKGDGNFIFEIIQKYISELWTMNL